MKNKVLMGLIGISATIMLSGCGKSAIECDDSDAQKTIVEIIEGTLKEDLRLGIIFEETKKSNPKLSNIRTESVDNELEKSECAAELSYDNGLKLDITYTLSKTSEGKLYAEVFGLR